MHYRDRRAFSLATINSVRRVAAMSWPRSHHDQEDWRTIGLFSDRKDRADCGSLQQKRKKFLFGPRGFSALSTSDAMRVRCYFIFGNPLVACVCSIKCDAMCDAFPPGCSIQQISADRFLRHLALHRLSYFNTTVP